MNTADHIPEEDLALFALALMEPEEAALILAHLEHCAECRQDVARLQGDLVAYAMTAEMQSPPAEARTRLLEAVALEKKRAPVQPAAEPVLTSRGDRRTFDDQSARGGLGFFGWFGWAVAAALATVSGWQFSRVESLHEQIHSQSAAVQHSQDQAADLLSAQAELSRLQGVLATLTDPGALHVALHLPKTPGAAALPEGHASYNSATGDLVFIGTHLRPISPGKTYQLWLLPASGTAPVPAGLFKPDRNGNGSVVLPTLPPNLIAKGFGVTVEDEGGSATPTPPIVLAGMQS